MATENIEVEIKFEVDKESFLRIKNKMKIIGKFIKKSYQSDEYLTPAHKNFLDFEHPYEWLRVGKRGGKTILNYKHWYPENVEIADYCDEFETEITNPEQLQKIFNVLNFKRVVTVEKKREVYEYGMFEVSMDEVTDLGYFVEVEALKILETPEKTREKLLEFAKTFGVANFRVHGGYPMALMRKNRLIKK